MPQPEPRQIWRYWSFVLNIILLPCQVLYRGMFSLSRQVFYSFATVTPRCLNAFGSDLRFGWRRLLGSRKPSIPHRDNPAIMKVASPEFKSLFTPELEKLASVFEKYGFEIRIAGGAVRDLLMGKCPKDLDFATIATPTQMKEMFTEEGIRMINERGESHGTITPRVNDKENFEITTLRIDVVTDGRRAKVEFTNDWLLDANRRDLTINSMFLGLDGTLYDYFYGFEDLQKRRVVFVGSAHDRITEDYLRILRYFRFFGRISSNAQDYDNDTIESIKATVHGLDNVSGERIWSELRLILTGNHGPCIFEKMLSVGISSHIGLPKEPNTKELQKVTDRTKGVKLHPVCFLAAVLNNMAEAVQLNSRLKMSTYERELLYFIVEHRDNKLCPKPLLPFQKFLLHTKYKVTDVREWCVEVLLYNGKSELAEEIKCWEVPKFPIKGNTLREYVSHPKQMTQLFTKLKDYWAENDFKPDTKDLIALIPDILEDIPKVSKRK